MGIMIALQRTGYFDDFFLGNSGCTGQNIKADEKYAVFHYCYSQKEGLKFVPRDVQSQHAMRVRKITEGPSPPASAMMSVFYTLPSFLLISQWG